MAEPMRPNARAIAVLGAGLAIAAAIWPAPVRADHDDCPHQPGWVPQDLGHILEAHRLWMIELGYVKLGADEPEPTIQPDPANLCRADLRGVDLSGAYLVEADLREADLSGADLSGANMIAADLRNASLVDTNLNGANLFKANLQNADLTRANLKDAHIPDANLTGAKLDDADLTGATD